MSTGKQDQRVQLVTTRELLTRIDNWRRKQDDLPTRSEAIRRMIDRVLREDGELGPPNRVHRRRSPRDRWREDAKRERQYSHALFEYGMDLSDRLAELRILRDHSR